MSPSGAFSCAPQDSEPALDRQHHLASILARFNIGLCLAGLREWEKVLDGQNGNNRLTKAND
jgi:hypothetical protein